LKHEEEEDGGEEEIRKQEEQNHGGFHLLGPRKVWGVVAKSSTGRP
jgi:hypothetical protein